MISPLNAGQEIYGIIGPIISQPEKSNLHDRPSSPTPLKPDRVEISDKGRKLSEIQKERFLSPKKDDELTDQEKREIERMKAVDREVRAHERAHVAAGAGVITSGASYEYDVGPDGKFYAVSGEVKIDASEGQDPEATIRKMQKVKMAALAPAQPSATDRAVAAQAAQIEAQARLELSREKSEEAHGQKEKATEFPVNKTGFIEIYDRGNNPVTSGINISLMA